MIDALYEFVETAEDYPKSGIVTVYENMIQFSGHDVQYKEHKTSAVKDLFSLLEKQGYFKQGTGDQYNVTGELSKFYAEGIFVRSKGCSRKLMMSLKKTWLILPIFKANGLKNLGCRLPVIPLNQSRKQ